MTNITKASAVAFTVITALAVTLLGAFQINETVAEETEDKGYKFAEGTSITVTFQFLDGVEMAQFEVFDQEAGFDRDDAPVFTLEKIVGKTPMLHHQADITWKYGASTSAAEDFGVEVVIASGGNILREFVYSGCMITDYHIQTDFDKEEGWMGKGFAVKDVYEFECRGYSPFSPVYYDMMNDQKKADTQSSLDLRK